MRGSRRENMKNVAISILMGFIAATSITWRNTFCEIGGGYIVSQVIWVFLTTYDEIGRKRRRTRRHKKMAES